MSGNLSDNLLEVKSLQKHYPINGGVLFRQIATVHAVDGVSFNVKKGETLGLVGESGCGKSTLGKSLLRLLEPTAGEVLFEGKDVIGLDKHAMRDLRREMQFIFQDPSESLNSRMTIREILSEPFVIHKIKKASECEKDILELLEVVGLPPSAIDRYPHEFSGGQRQRIGIARAIALKPKLIVCDEPVSALDVSIQSQIVNLLLDLQKKMGLTFIFIAHDLSVVKHISDRVAVMYLGKMVELADADELYADPKHPYTKALISAIPNPDPKKRSEKIILEGDVPSPRNPPSGCRFHTRCPIATEICSQKVPEMKDYSGPGSEHLAACHRVEK